MHDLNRIKDLLSRQEILTGQYEELDALVATLKTVRGKQEFIPEEMSRSIRDMLTTIQAGQNSFLSDYEALEFGETPATITECKAELDDYERYIIEKSSFVEVINFVLGLDSDNSAAKSALEQHQALVAAYDCRSNSVEQCTSDLKKYILLRKAYEEKDPAKRLSCIIELSPMIDFPLVVALNTNALISAGSTPVSAATVSPAPVAEAVEPAPVSVPEFEVQKPEAPETLIRESAFPEMQAEKNWDSAPFPMPDFTVPGSAPVSAPAYEADLESGLNSELTQVLSRETIAANLSSGSDYRKTSQTQSFAPKGFENLPAWVNLGIFNPAQTCYAIPDTEMAVFRCERPKKFSPTDFQREMALKTGNRFHKINAIKDAYKYGATTPNLLASLLRENPQVVFDACNTLVDSGYLKAFELKGFTGFDRLYVLTASGRRVFTNPDTAAVLNLPPVEKPATPPFSSHANNVLNRQLFLRSKKLMEEYMPSRQFNVGSFILEANSFINFFPTTNGTGTYAYVGVSGNDVKDYLIFKIELQELLPSLSTVNVVGMTKEHARSLADWIYESFPDILRGKTLQYFAYNTGTYYSYPEGAPLTGK